MADEGKIALSALKVGAGTLTSRILGFARDVLTAAAFGTGTVMDAFVMAFTIPNLFRRIFGEGALHAAFIPIFTEYAESEERDAQRFFNVVMTSLAAVLGALMVAGWAVCGVAAFLCSAGGTWRLFWVLLALMLPYLPLVCLTALASAALNVKRVFALPALMPALLNVCWIVAVAALVPRWGIGAVAVAITLAGGLQFFLLAGLLGRHEVKLRAVWDTRSKGLRRVAKLMATAAIGLSVMQLNVVFDRLIAQFFAGAGANSALYFGNRLMQFPLGVFGIALATAVFPTLSSRAAAGDRAGLGSTLERALRLVFLITFPCIVLTIVLRAEIVRLVFERGSFNAQSTARTAGVLMFYSLGLWAYCGVHVVGRAFYALQDMKTPVRVSIYMVAANFLLNLALVWPMKESGLALATAMTSSGNLLILLWLARSRIGPVGKGLLLFCGKALAASSVGGVAAWFCLRALGDAAFLPALPHAILVERAARVLLPTIAGGLGFFGGCWALGLGEVKALIRAFRVRAG
ncbi:MAG: murein biosynthesis integral membrane protein MurJ [Alphaproteobacteria bacterium]